MGCDKCGNRLELREGKKWGDEIYCHGCWRKEESKNEEIARLKAELAKRCTNERDPSCPYGTCKYHCES